MQAHILYGGRCTYEGTFSWNVSVFSSKQDADAVADYLNGVVEDIRNNKISSDEGIRLMSEHDPGIEVWDDVDYGVQTLEMK